jgi:hypothetical protein
MLRIICRCLLVMALQREARAQNQFIICGFVVWEFQIQNKLIDQSKINSLSVSGDSDLPPDSDINPIDQNCNLMQEGDNQIYDLVEFLYMSGRIECIENETSVLCGGNTQE